MDTCLADPFDAKQEPSEHSFSDLCGDSIQLHKIDDGKSDIDAKSEHFGEGLNGEEEEEEDEEEEDLTEELLVQMGYWKPEPKKPPQLNTPNERVKLVSAFKGSREKEGIAAKERRRVSWAPDVYDPTPSAPEHFASSVVVRHRDDSKKSGKNKQKWGGKGSDDGGGGGGKSKGGKEKKQGKKYGGGGSANKSLDEEEMMINGGDSSGVAAEGGGRKGGGKGKGKKQGKRHGGTSKLFDTLDDYY